MSKHHLIRFSYVVIILITLGALGGCATTSKTSESPRQPESACEWMAVPIAFKLTTPSIDTIMMSAILQQSFDYGVNERCGDMGGMTPLQMAVGILDDGDRPLVRHLLAQGADVHAVMGSVQGKLAGGTAMHTAAALGSRTSILELLIEFGADVTAQTDSGAVPLHLAAAGNDLETVELLLERDSDVTALDKRRWTPLHYAASETTDERVIVTLIDTGGVDIEAITSTGQTAHDLIQGNSVLKDSEAARFLEVR